jgi:hypothetical protein
MKPITCKEAVEFILRKEERKLSIIQRIKLWRHLTICSLCRIFSLQNKVMNEAMKHRRDKQVILSAEEKEKIIRNVLDERRK